MKKKAATFKSDIVATIDAAALQNSMAQRYSLPGSRLAIQVDHIFVCVLEL
jgi:hypothetical protein